MIKAKKHILGIDPASKTFQVALLSSLTQKKPITPKPFENDDEGFSSLVLWLSSKKASKKDVLICIENTGVYNERLLYFLYNKGFSVILLHPLDVSKAPCESPHKTDKEDSIKIAKYAFRHLDKLNCWNPPKEVVEEISQILTARELLVKGGTALKNAYTAQKRKKFPQKKVLKVFEKEIVSIEKAKKTLEKELERLIKLSTPKVQQHVSNLKSIPGVALLLSCHMLVETNGFEKNLEYKRLNSYFGICPLKYESGTSVKKRETSKKHGPSGIRTLLHLASRSICTHQERFRNYFRRKEAQGKKKKLIYNNVANKLVKLMCSIINSNSSYQKDYISLNPIFTK